MNCPHLYETRRHCPLCRREDGQQLALQNKDEWRLKAQEAIRQLAYTGRPFTSEDVTNIVGYPSGSNDTNRNNAVGAVLARMAKTHLIRHVGWTQAKNVQSHGRTLKQWAGYAGTKSREPDTP